MGGIIEDRIFEALMGDKLTTSEIIGKLEKISYGKIEYGTVSHHLRKMYNLKQLNREKKATRQYAYYNPRMVK